MLNDEWDSSGYAEGVGWHSLTITELPKHLTSKANENSKRQPGAFLREFQTDQQVIVSVKQKRKQLEIGWCGFSNFVG